VPDTKKSSFATDDHCTSLVIAAPKICPRDSTNLTIEFNDYNAIWTWRKSQTEFGISLKLDIYFINYTKRNVNSCKPRVFKFVDVFALSVADSWHALHVSSRVYRKWSDLSVEITV